MLETFEASMLCRDEPVLDGREKIRKKGKKKTRMLGCASKDNRRAGKKSRFERIRTYVYDERQSRERAKPGDRGAWSLSCGGLGKRGSTTQ